MNRLTSYNLQVLETLNRNNKIQDVVLVCYATGCARFLHESLAAGGRRQVEQQMAGCRRGAVDGLQVAAGGGLASVTGKKVDGRGATPNRGGSRRGRRTDPRGR